MIGLMKRALVGGALVVGLTLGAQAGEIRLLSFGGATNLPTWMALEKGFMEREGVKLTFATTNGSVEQIRDFYAGKYDVISTAFDNIVAYAEGQSDIPLPGPFAGPPGVTPSLCRGPDPVSASGPCIAAAILRGEATPLQCPAFGLGCTPEHPLGAPMVSGEGACAAYHHYRPPQGAACSAPPLPR
jgi:hypothetical protein